MRKQGIRADKIIRYFRENGDAERFYVAFYRGDDADVIALERYSDDDAALMDQISSNLSLKLYSSALLMMYDKIRREWSEIGKFPR